MHWWLFHVGLWPRSVLSPSPINNPAAYLTSLLGQLRSISNTTSQKWNSEEGEGGERREEGEGGEGGERREEGEEWEEEGGEGGEGDPWQLESSGRLSIRVLPFHFSVCIIPIWAVWDEFYNSYFVFLDGFYWSVVDLRCCINFCFIEK